MPREVRHAEQAGSVFAAVAFRPDVYKNLWRDLRVFCPLKSDIRYALQMSRRKVSTTIYIHPEQDEALKLLHGKTKVPVAEYIRQGIDLILERHRAALPGQQRSLFEDLASPPKSP